MGILCDIKYWEYAGGIVKGTREFCKNKVGKAFTDDEVRSWAKEIGRAC